MKQPPPPPTQPNVVVAEGEEAQRNGRDLSPARQGEGCAACADDVQAGVLEVDERPALLFSLPLARLSLRFSASLPASLVLVPPCSAFKR